MERAFFRLKWLSIGPARPPRGSTPIWVCYCPYCAALDPPAAVEMNSAFGRGVMAPKRSDSCRTKATLSEADQS